MLLRLRSTAGGMVIASAGLGLPVSDVVAGGARIHTCRSKFFSFGLVFSSVPAPTSNTPSSFSLQTYCLLVNDACVK